MERGILAEFESGQDAVRAAKELRAEGYRRLEIFSPYPLEGAEEALEIGRPARIPAAVAGAGFAAAGLALAVQWYCNAYDYPLDVGGRPLDSLPAWIIITFEMGILFAALAAFLAVLAGARLPWLAHPIFAAEGFERASIDRFFVGIEAEDPRFEARRSAAEAVRLGALRVTSVDGGGGRGAVPLSSPAVDRSENRE